MISVCSIDIELDRYGKTKVRYVPDSIQTTIRLILEHIHQSLIVLVRGYVVQEVGIHLVQRYEPKNAIMLAWSHILFQLYTQITNCRLAAFEQQNRECSVLKVQIALLVKGHVAVKWTATIK